LQLWVFDVAKGSAHELSTFRLNAVLGAPPKPSEAPTGANVEENLGKVTPTRTYEDLLKTPGDKSIFEYYSSMIRVAKFHGDTRDPGAWVAELEVELVREIRRHVAEIKAAHRVAFVQQIAAGQIGGPSGRLPTDLGVQSP
jgi:hypothetical protein